MRKQIFTALESETPDVSITKGTMLSLEEEAVIRDEAFNHAADAEAGMKSVNHLTEICDGLEDLAVIAGGIKEATPTEANLINNVVDMSVAGTDVTGDEIAPSMESYIGKPIAIESFVETAKAIWANIKKFIKIIWEKMGHFYRQITQVFANMKKRLEKLKVDLQILDGEPGKEIEIKSGVISLSVNGKPCKSEADFKQHIKYFNQVSTYVYTKYMTSINNVGKYIAEALDEFNLTTPDESTKILCYKLNTLHGLFAIPQCKVGDEKRFPNLIVTESSPLFGNKSLFAKYPPELTGTVEGDVSFLSIFSNVGIFLENTSEEESLSHDFVMTPLKKDTMIELIDQMIEILKPLHDFDQGSTYSAIQKTKDDLVKASEKASQAKEPVKTNNVVSPLSQDAANKAEPHYNALVKMNTAYASWVRSPGIVFMKHAITTINAITMVIHKSMESYILTHPTDGNNGTDVSGKIPEFRGETPVAT